MVTYVGHLKNIIPVKERGMTGGSWTEPVLDVTVVGGDKPNMLYYQHFRIGEINTFM